MGFIAQAFGNPFWSSSTAHPGIQQNAVSSSRKSRPKTKSSKDDSSLGVRVAPAESLPSVPLSNANKKRRHASPDATFRPYVDVANDLGRSSLSSSSAASDRPLILSPAKPKGKSAAGGQQVFVSEQNQNQSAYGNGTWANALQSPPRLQARPPTTNSLDMFERSQLVRRSRKLGAILGETPRLVDVNEDEQGINEALGKLEARGIGRPSPTTPRAVSSTSERPSYRRSLTLGAISVGSNLTTSPSVSAPRRSFLLNDENIPGAAGDRASLHNTAASPRFGRSRSSARTPPVLRLSPTTPARENTHPYFARRHSSDISIRRGTSLNSVDLNVGLGSGSDISAPKVPDSDNSRNHSSAMPAFARSRSPTSYLDTMSFSSKISLNELDANTSMPSRSIAADLSLPPTPTTPLTPVMTQAEDARRKMRKLARHLGESVPVDLVLGNAGGRRAPHDLRTETAAPQYLQVPTAATPIVKSTNDSTASFSFSLAKPPLGHRKAQSVWKGANVAAPRPSRRMVRRASSAEQLRVDTPTTPQMTAEEKARHVHRAMKMLQMFGAPPPNELYTNTKACSLDLPPSSAFSCTTDQSPDRRVSMNNFKDLAYILDHDNRNSLLALIGDNMSDTLDDPTASPCVDTFSGNSRDLMEHNEEPFQARRARANKLAKFFGVSYRDLFDAVCADDAQLLEAEPGPSTSEVPQPAHAPHQHLTGSMSEVMTNNGVKWVEPKSVDEVLDRLRAMKAIR